MSTSKAAHEGSCSKPERAVLVFKVLTYSDIATDVGREDRVTEAAGEGLLWAAFWFLSHVLLKGSAVMVQQHLEELLVLGGAADSIAGCCQAGPLRLAVNLEVCDASGRAWAITLKTWQNVVRGEHRPTFVLENTGLAQGAAGACYRTPGCHKLAGHKGFCKGHQASGDPVVVTLGFVRKSDSPGSLAVAPADVAALPGSRRKRKRSLLACSGPSEGYMQLLPEKSGHPLHLPCIPAAVDRLERGIERQEATAEAVDGLLLLCSHLEEPTSRRPDLHGAAAAMSHELLPPPQPAAHYPAKVPGIAAGGQRAEAVAPVVAAPGDELLTCFEEVHEASISSAAGRGVGPSTPSGVLLPAALGNSGDWAALDAYQGHAANPACRSGRLEACGSAAAYKAAAFATPGAPWRTSPRGVAAPIRPTARRGAVRVGADGSLQCLWNQDWAGSNHHQVSGLVASSGLPAGKQAAQQLLACLPTLLQAQQHGLLPAPSAASFAGQGGDGAQDHSCQQQQQHKHSRHSHGALPGRPLQLDWLTAQPAGSPSWRLQEYIPLAATNARLEHCCL
ncbi:hypothetical protein N2152v2_005730 [Parachlorella kessleri]